MDQTTAWETATTSSPWGLTPQFEAFKSYLSEEILLEEAVHKIVSETKVREGQKLVYEMIISCAEDCLDAQGSIVGLLEGLAGFKEGESEGERKGEVDWSDIGYLMEIWRERNDALSSLIWEKTSHSHGNPSITHFQKFINFSSFSSQLLTPFPIFTSVLPSALWLIVFAFERPVSPSKPLKIDQWFTLDMRVQAACYWFIYAGKQIKKEGEGFGDSWGQMGELFKGEGMDERWKFWRERVGVLKGAGVSEETKALLERAEVAMGKAERGVEREKVKGRGKGKK